MVLTVHREGSFVILDIFVSNPFGPPKTALPLSGRGGGRAVGTVLGNDGGVAVAISGGGGGAAERGSSPAQFVEAQPRLEALSETRDAPG